MKPLRTYPPRPPAEPPEPKPGDAVLKVDQPTVLEAAPTAEAVEQPPEAPASESGLSLMAGAEPQPEAAPEARSEPLLAPAVDLAASSDEERPADASDAALPTPEEIARIRAMRRPLEEASYKLALPERRGYKRHWFKDEGGRIELALSNGWTHVKDLREGKPTKRPGGTGRDNGVLWLYAMELPEVFWREDMDARHRRAGERMEGLKKDPIRVPSGMAEKSDGGKFYSPHADGEVVKTLAR